MIVKEIYSKGNEYGEGEYYSIFVDKKHALSAGSGQPEDSTLRRDLSFVFNVPHLLRKAYEAGVAGEQFEIIQEDGD